MTSCEPDSSVSGDGDDSGDDNANDLESTPKPPHPLLKSHIPEAVDDVLSSTGFSFGRFTAWGGEARQGAQLHCIQMKYSSRS